MSDSQSLEPKGKLDEEKKEEAKLYKMLIQRSRTIIPKKKSKTQSEESSPLKSPDKAKSKKLISEQIKEETDSLKTDESSEMVRSTPKNATGTPGKRSQVKFDFEPPKVRVTDPSKFSYGNWHDDDKVEEDVGINASINMSDNQN